MWDTSGQQKFGPLFEILNRPLSIIILFFVFLYIISEHFVIIIRSWKIVGHLVNLNNVECFQIIVLPSRECIGYIVSSLINVFELIFFFNQCSIWNNFWKCSCAKKTLQKYGDGETKCRGRDKKTRGRMCEWWHGIAWSIAWMSNFRGMCGET